MAFDGVAGIGVQDDQFQSYSGPLRVDGADGDVELTPYQQDVRIVNLDANDDITVYLPPVSQCQGKFFYFLRTGGQTQSVFIRPISWLTSSLTAGDSNIRLWDGGEGFDMDAQWDHLLLFCTGDFWLEISSGASGIT